MIGSHIESQRMGEIVGLYRSSNREAAWDLEDALVRWHPSVINSFDAWYRGIFFKPRKLARHWRTTINQLNNSGMGLDAKALEFCVTYERIRRDKDNPVVLSELNDVMMNAQKKTRERARLLREHFGPEESGPP